MPLHFVIIRVMPQPRNRYAANGKPLPCAVRIPPVLAQVLYRERIRGRFRDETELVIAVIRKWAEGLEPVDWESVYAELRKEEEADAAAQEPAPPKGKKRK